MGGSIPWSSLFKYVEATLPISLCECKAHTKRMGKQPARLGCEHTNSGPQEIETTVSPLVSQCRVGTCNTRLSRPSGGAGGEPNDLALSSCAYRGNIAGHAEATPHLIRCRLTTNNTVDLEQFPTLSYAVETAEFTTVETDSFTYKRQRRNGRTIRLPASRWQLSPWLSQEYALDSYCRTMEESFRYLRNNQSKLLKYHRSRRRSSHDGRGANSRTPRCAFSASTFIRRWQSQVLV